MVGRKKYTGAMDVCMSTRPENVVGSNTTRREEFDTQACGVLPIPSPARCPTTTRKIHWINTINAGIPIVVDTFPRPTATHTATNGKAVARPSARPMGDNTTEENASTDDINGSQSMDPGCNSCRE
jgi:hypothetical protein